MTPGIHRNIPAEQYHRWPGVSNSMLSKLARSAAHLRDAMDNPSEPTPDMIVGSVAHTLVLEPGRYADEYRVLDGPVNAKTGKPYGSETKAYEAWLAELELSGELAGRTIISQAQYELASSLADAIETSPEWPMLKPHITGVELSLMAIDDETGLLLRGRLDAICPGILTIGDIKTAKDASEEGFKRAIRSRGYHRQAAFYIDLARANGIKVDHFVFAVVEKAKPYATGFYRLLDDAIARGRADYRRLLRLYAECERTGSWPGYTTEIRDIDIPAWEYNRTIEEE